jgi:hypothetical protein
MPTVETTLGYLIDVRDEFGLEEVSISYVFKLGCGCSVYNKEDALGHLWDKCEHQDSEFWCERYTEHGRTVKHHVRIDEIDTIWAGFDVARESLNILRAKWEELETPDGRLAFKNTREYVKILNEFDNVFRNHTMTLLEEKNMRDQITAWYLKEDVKPPQFEEIHKVALAKVALDSALTIFEKEPQTERLTVFGFDDCLPNDN